MEEKNKMILKSKKNIMFILAIICIALIIPCSFAGDLDNETLSVDDTDTTASEDTAIYVTNDENNGDGSQDNPYNSISQAVSEFNSTENSNIYIKNGNYEINTEIEIDKDITIIGESAKDTILDAKSQGSVFKIKNKAKVTLINLTFINANSNKGAILGDSVNTLTIENCAFENNTNSAIFCYDYFSNIKVYIKNSNFTNNKDNSAIVIAFGNLLNITDCIFENNENSNMGGAILLYNNFNDAYIYNSKFINNSAIKGSAIALNNAGNLLVENSEFINNNAPTITDESSVIYDLRSNNGEVTLTLNKNTFTGNSVANIYTKDNVKVEYLDKNTKLTCSDVEKYVDDDFNYIARLTDNDGNPLVGKEIIATLTNNYNNSITTITNITNSEGNAIFSLKNQGAGKYSVSTKFAGDNDYDEVTITNLISIRTESSYNIIFTENNVHISEGDSYNATAYIYDEYLNPVRLLDSSFSVDWYDNFGKHLIVEGGLYKVTDGNKIVFDINRCHLVTRDEPYKLNFEVSSIGSAILTVDLSKDLSNIDPNIGEIYVSKTGSDETGDGTYENPLATIQTALSANYAYGGGKTIKVGEGVYEISTYTVLGNVTVVGEKGKTILKQTNGRLGMLEIDNKNTVKLINLTFTNGYATALPDSLIHVTDDSILYLESCELYNNSAYAGGSITVSRGGTIYINNSYFHENKGILNTNVGGAIYIDRGIAYITNSLFENNTASDGGAIFLGFEAEANIINTTFVNNTAYVTTHSEGGGGAIYTRSNNLNIENCSFIENYAELYGGAIYIDYGCVNILKSYFEENHVKYVGSSKGSAIESAYNQYVNITMHYSVLVCEENYDGNYLVLIHEFEDENHTVDLNYNFWKTTGMKAYPGVGDEVKIILSIINEYIYTGDIVEFTIEMVSYNIENGTSPLNGTVHDLNLLLIPKIGEIKNNFVTVVNNKATFIYNATTIGEETIQMGDLLLYATHKFTVQDGSDKIDLNPTIEVKTGKISEITVNLDENIASNITIRVNNEEYSVEVKNSKAVLKVNTMPGDYNVKAIYPGTETYRGFVLVDTFNVAKFASSITVKDITTYFNGNLEVKLLTDEESPIANELIKIIINETEYSVVTNEDGIGILELNLDDIGIYNVNCIFEGNKNYNSSDANSTLTIEFDNLILTAQENVNITPIKGSISFTLSDNHGNLIKNTEVIITFNSTEHKIKTDSNGVATLNLDNNYLKVNEYEISAKVEGTKVYSTASNKTKLNVVKASATIKVENISVYSNTGNLTVTLVDEEGNPIYNATLLITIKEPDEIKTDENGTAILNLNLTPGNYTVTVKLVENDIYGADDVTSTINVKETITSITAPEVTVYYSNGKFSAELVDVTGQAIANARLIFKINNDYIATTDENGIATITIDNLALGSYNVIITFEGNSLFQPSNATSTINVVSSIIVNDTIKAYNSDYDFIAILKDSNGDSISNVTVSLLVNGKQYNVKTDTNGVLKLVEKLSPGTYAITLTNPVTGERTSNYAQIVSRFSENKNIAMYYNDGTSFKVRIMDDNGNPVGAGELVVFKINGKTLKAKTDAKGYASVKITNTPKKYTITATYKEQTIKNIVTVKQVLKAVKKNIKVKKSAKKLIIKATLKQGKKALKNKKITFKFKGKKYTAKTNKKGIAKVKVKKSVLKKLKKGKKYTVSITYLKDTVKCYVKVKK